MILIDHTLVDRAWELMSPGLSRAIYPDDLGSVYTLDDLYKGILSQEFLGYYQESSGYAGLMCVLHYPFKKILLTFMGGKDPSNSTPLDLKDMDDFFVEVARIFDCSVIKVQGRKGWERWTKDLGYKTETINLFKEVSP